MADVNGSFVNESYATPAQLAQLRATAEALRKRSGQDVSRPTGAIANMLEALSAGLYQNRAAEQERNAIRANTDMGTQLFTQMQNGQRVDPRNLAAMYANPMISPENRALITALVQPKAVEDVRGRPAQQSVLGGVQSQPINQGNGPYEPGYRAPESAGPVSTLSAIPANPGSITRQDLPPPASPSNGSRAKVPSTGRWYGDDEAERQGLYPPSAGGGGANRTVQPTPASSGEFSRLDRLAEKGREYQAATTFSQGGAESVAGQQKADIASAFNAPEIKRIVGTMRDDLRAHGDQMTFGPTAEWSNRVKRTAANYLPGPMKSSLEALASADSFEKMSAQLSGMLARNGGGTDAQLFNSMKSVPGQHNSRQGAEALLHMLDQQADQQIRLREYVAQARTVPEYEALRRQFFAANPIINPITGRPIAQDVEQQSQGRPGNGGSSNGRARILSVE